MYNLSYLKNVTDVVESVINFQTSSAKQNFDLVNKYSNSMLDPFESIFKKSVDQYATFWTSTLKSMKI